MLSASNGESVILAESRSEPLDDSDPGPMTDEEWEPFAAATGIDPLNDSRQEFVESMVRYTKTHERWSQLSKEDAVRSAIRVMLDDVGAAQGFLNAIGVKVDLYAD